MRRTTGDADRAEVQKFRTWRSWGNQTIFVRIINNLRRFLRNFTRIPAAPRHRRWHRPWPNQLRPWQSRFGGRSQRVRDAIYSSAAPRPLELADPFDDTVAQLQRLDALAAQQFDRVGGHEAVRSAAIGDHRTVLRQLGKPRFQFGQRH